MTANLDSYDWKRETSKGIGKVPPPQQGSFFVPLGLTNPGRGVAYDGGALTWAVLRGLLLTSPTMRWWLKQYFTTQQGMRKKRRPSLPQFSVRRWSFDRYVYIFFTNF